MEKQFPKNVKQIGNVSDEPKIYVEDYVTTYLDQLQETVGEEPVASVLIGEWVTVKEQKAVYISGAIRLEGIELKGRELQLEDEAFEKIEEERKKYFPKETVVGWCLIFEGHPLGMIRETSRIHEKYFKKDHSVFIWKDILNEEEVYYAYKYGELMQMGGYYIYYDRNPEMQNYMIGTRRQIGVTPSEVVEDRAAKDFRVAVRDQMQVKKKKERKGTGRVASIALALLVLVMGVLMLNNFDKMKRLQSSLETVSKNVAGETSASVNRTEEKNTSGLKTAGGDQSVDTDQLKNNIGTKGSGDGQTLGATTEEPTEEESETTLEQNTGDNAKTDETKNESQGDSEEYYYVERGDTLDSISRKLYGDNSGIESICKMNGLSDGNLIYVGQKLLLP